MNFKEWAEQQRAWGAWTAPEAAKAAWGAALAMRSESTALTQQLGDALAGLLGHCDYTNDAETDFEKAVMVGRQALDAYIKGMTR